ncbi:hypothetical protein M9458_054107 [Cirrhinus mrigala]|uniref:Integrase zinc-binding domain-containing protein n=1 Tax=Cirrhinus mrigala TaxID=683832 RepID=A0ABD0MKW7_CIRMR
MYDIPRGHPRSVVPKQWRRAVFDKVHGLSHPGWKASHKLVSSKFAWHGLKKDVWNWVSACTACQRAKVPEQHFDHVNIDLTWSFATFPWPEAVPLSLTTTAEVALAFIDTWVARFGTPSDITSDHGPQFTSGPWSTASPYHGIPCFHLSLKSALSLTDDRWVDQLPWVLLGLRTAPKADLQTSSVELVYGQTLCVPGDFIPDSTRPWAVPSDQPALLERVNAFKPVPTSHHGMTATWIPKDLSTAEFVFVRHDAHRNALRPPYDEPFRVLEAGVKSFLVDIGGRPERVTVGQLKPAHGKPNQPMVPVVAPKRGRSATNKEEDPRAESLIAEEVQQGASSQRCTRSGRQVRAPRKLMLPVLVNSGGTCVGVDTSTSHITE